MTLSEFLLARIAEDEAVARAATRGSWLPHTGAVIEAGYEPEQVADCWRQNVRTQEADANADHIARHDPARVLAECEAKRRIVELHHISDEDIYDADGTERPGKDCTECWDEFPCGTLRLLALPHAAHQDYRDEWRP